MSYVIKIDGMLFLDGNSKKDFIQAFSDFLKEKNIEFLGNIGNVKMKTGKSIPVIHIDSVNLSNRIKNVLYREQIFDLGTFSTYYEEDIKKIPGLGNTAYQELLSVLEQHGIHPVSYMKETTDFKRMYPSDRKELHMKNIRTLEDLYALSNEDIVRIFHYGTRLCGKLLKKKQEHDELSTPTNRKNR